MVKKLSATLVAMCFVAIAQPAVGQTAADAKVAVGSARAEENREWARVDALKTASPEVSARIVNQAVTLKAVTPRTATTAAASVTLANGVVWSFDGTGKLTSAGATVAGVAVSPSKLTAGMSCVLNGTRAPGRNTIATLACK